MKRIILSLLLLSLLSTQEAAAQAGTPLVDPADPHRFVMNGQPFYPIGYTPGLGALTRRCDGVSRESYYKALHSWLQSRGIRTYRTVFTFGQAFAGATADSASCAAGQTSFDETLPYPRTGPGLAIDGKPKFNLDQWNQAHFDFWRRVILDARQKGIVVQLAVFDSWHLNKRQHTAPVVGWGRDYDFYYGPNNINGITFDINDNSQLSWHTSDQNSALFLKQKALVQKAVAELGDLQNLIWEVCNEPDSISWSLALAPSFGGSRLVMPRDLPDHRQTLDKTEHDPAVAHEVLKSQYFPTATAKPLIAHNDCDCFQGTEGQREKAWGVLTAGAHIDYFFNLEKAQDFAAGSTADTGARYLGYLGTFLTQTGAVPRDMEPLDSAVVGPVANGSWALGRPGEEYVIYKRALSGNSSVTVSGLPSAYLARWFDPRNGVLQATAVTGTPVSGGLLFQPPSLQTQDWVLHIKQLAAAPDICVSIGGGANVPDGGLYTFPTRALSQLPVSQLFDLCNCGTATLTISNPTSLVSGSGFSQIASPASSVAPSSCTTFRVRFHVAAAGTYTGSVSITNNDADENPFNFTLRATAVSSPEIRVTTNPQGANVADGSSYAFPVRSLGQLPVSQLFDLCNDGLDPLIISNPTSLVSGVGFSQIGTAPSSTVQPWTCTNFRVRCHVNAVGTYTGSVSITNNDANENPFNFSLTCTAVP